MDERVEKDLQEIFSPMGKDNASAFVEFVKLITAVLQIYWPELPTAEAFAEIEPYFTIELDRLIESNPDKLSLPTLTKTPIDETGEPAASIIEKLLLKAARAAESAKNEKRYNLQSLKDIPIKSHIIANSALMNDLSSKKKNPINAGVYDLVISNEKENQPELTAYTMINYDPSESGIKIKGHITEYQRQVADAIFSLYLAAEEQGMPPMFTTDMIFKAMPGGGEKASPQQKSAITKTIKIFKHLDIYIDVTDEYRKRNIIDNNTIKRLSLEDSFLVPLKVNITAKNGKNITAYFVRNQPLVLEHCRKTKMYITVPKEYLTIREIKRGKVSSEPIKMNGKRQALTGYLLRRILTIKRDHEKHKNPQLSKTILFETIFNECEISTKNREQLRRYRDFCYNALNYWRHLGIIENYKTRHAGSSGKIEAIILEF